MLAIGTVRQTQCVSQKQTLSQAQAQSLAVLVMCNQELDVFLRTEYADNPFLEEDPTAATPVLDIDVWVEPVGGVREPYREWDGEHGARSGDLFDTPGDGLREKLLSQLNWAHYSDAEWALIGHVIDFLDPNGYLCCGAADIAATAGLPEAEVQRCLDELSELEPPGLFALDLPDCLIRQLRARGELNDALATMARNHLPDIAAGRFHAIAAALRLPLPTVKQYARTILSLRPRPLEGCSPEPIQYTVPDLIVEQASDGWSVRLNKHESGAYQLSSTYLRMMEGSQGEMRDYFERKLEHARFVLRCVERRRDTLFAVVRAVVAAQSTFFLRQGPPAPLTLSDIAGATGLHSSTVSRAVSGKYIQCPRGVLPMKALFAAETARGAGLSSDAARELLRRAIEAEDARAPLSDAALAQALAAQGMLLSRRTIAKYRQQLGIVDSYQRAAMRGE